MGELRAHDIEASLCSDIKRILGRLGEIRQGRVKKVDAKSHQLGRAVESLNAATKHLTGCLIPSED